MRWEHSRLRSRLERCDDRDRRRGKRRRAIDRRIDGGVGERYVRAPHRRVHRAVGDRGREVGLDRGKERSGGGRARGKRIHHDVEGDLDWLRGVLRG